MMIYYLYKLRIDKFLFFFFQAEDGIRDRNVTGVQTCALPISAVGASFTLHGAGVSGGIAIGRAHLVSTARLEVAHYEVAPQEIEAEHERFDPAIAQVQGELAALQ